MGLRDRLEVAGHVLAGERVPLGAVAREQPVEIALRMLLRSLEEHVLEEVGHAGGARDLVAAADVVPDPERDDRRVTRFERVQHQAVVEATRSRGVSECWDKSILGADASGPSCPGLGQCETERSAISNEVGHDGEAMVRAELVPVPEALEWS